MQGYGREAPRAKHDYAPAPSAACTERTNVTNINPHQVPADGDAQIRQQLGNVDVGAEPHAEHELDRADDRVVGAGDQRPEKPELQPRDVTAEGQPIVSRYVSGFGSHGR